MYVCGLCNARGTECNFTTTLPAARNHSPLKQSSHIRNVSHGLPDRDVVDTLARCRDSLNAET
jgi:hypothetical protein